MLYDSIYLRYKNESVVLDVRTMVSYPWERRITGKRHEEASGVLVMFCFLIWVL